MAILQIVKEITPLRRQFHSNGIARSVGERGGNQVTIGQLRPAAMQKPF